MDYRVEVRDVRMPGQTLKGWIRGGQIVGWGWEMCVCQDRKKTKGMGVDFKFWYSWTRNPFCFFTTYAQHSIYICLVNVPLFFSLFFSSFFLSFFFYLISPHSPWRNLQRGRKCGERLFSFSHLIVINIIKYWKNSRGDWIYTFDYIYKVESNTYKIIGLL